MICDDNAFKSLLSEGDPPPRREFELALRLAPVILLLFVGVNPGVEAIPGVSRALLDTDEAWLSIANMVVQLVFTGNFC